VGLGLCACRHRSEGPLKEDLLTRIYQIGNVGRPILVGAEGARLARSMTEFANAFRRSRKVPDVVALGFVFVLTYRLDEGPWFNIVARKVPKMSAPALDPSCNPLGAVQKMVPPLRVAAAASLAFARRAAFGRLRHNTHLGKCKIQVAPFSPYNSTGSLGGLPSRMIKTFRVPEAVIHASLMSSPAKGKCYCGIGVSPPL